MKDFGNDALGGVAFYFLAWGFEAGLGGTGRPSWAMIRSAFVVGQGPGRSR